MARFLCGRFPRGAVKIRTLTGQIVEFTDGRAEVSDPELCAALLDVPAVFKISLAEGEALPVPPPPEPPDDPVPGGWKPGMSVTATLAWVNGDPDKAKYALDYETGAEGLERATAIDRLERVIDASE